MKRLKKSILACGAALALSATALIGTTFAWFTDSVTNSGNKIQAGTLKINAFAFDTGTGGITVNDIGGKNYTFEAEGEDLRASAAPIVNETNFAPGDVNAKLLEVTNAGSIDAMVKLNFTVEGTLTDALWFDFVRIDESNAVTGTFGEKPMSELVSLSETQLPLPAAQEGTSRVRFVLVYGMNEEAGNEYQGGTFTADVAILARQNVNGAQYPTVVSDEEGLTDALAAGGNVLLSQDIVTSPALESIVADSLNPNIYITKDTELNMNGKELSFSEELQGADLGKAAVAFFAVTDGTLTIDGDGVFNAEAGFNTGYCINVNGGNVVINGGTFYGAMSAVQVQKGTAYINGGFFDLAPTIKAYNTPENAYERYLINCVDASYKNGTAVIEIRGGTFVNYDPSNNAAEGEGTNFVADGYTVISEKQANGDIWYTVVPIEASADTAQSFAEALKGLNVAGDVEKIITIENDIEDITGIQTAAGNTLEVNFGGHSVSVGTTVGSEGTVTNGMQLLEGSKVTLRNGTYRPGDDKVFILVQNYCDLLLDNFTLDVSGFENCYALSNNCSYTVLTGNTNIITGDNNRFALDTCNFASYTLPTVELDENMTGTVQGIVYVDGGYLIMKNGTVDGTIKYTENGGSLVISGGTVNGDIEIAEQVVGGQDEIKGVPRSIVISGGTINGRIINESAGQVTITVTGGTFIKFDPTNYIPAGYKVISEEQTNGDIWYTVVAE